jgi:hypothetical protein
MGLPLRVALPIFVVFAVALLGVVTYLLRIGFGTTGAAFGPSGTSQGGARAQATPAPIATEPPGTFTVPQTGTGPVRGGSTALPGAQTGGGTPTRPPSR